MITKEPKKVYYTTEAVVDVICDKCSKSLIGDENEILEVTIQGWYLLESQGSLSRSGLNGERQHLCRECLTPVLELLNVPIDEIF